VPDWFQTSERHDTEILGRTSIEIDDAVGILEVDLRIRDGNGEIAVQEQIPGTRFPKTCHERHLQSDENFCLGLNAGKGIISIDHAVVWWGLLDRFLKLQRVAERTKRWPPQQELAHGNAGPHQIAAFEAAKELGLENEYLSMLAGERTWFSDSYIGVNAKGRLNNSWLPCPVGCRKNGKPIARFRCCKPKSVARLIIEERKRQEETAAFYRISRSLLKEQCCGTMLNCGLRGSASTVPLQASR
jgi:hypothetical protein